MRPTNARGNHARLKNVHPRFQPGRRIYDESVLMLRSPPLLPTMARMPLWLRLVLGAGFALAGWGFRELLVNLSQVPIQFLTFFPLVIAAVFLLGFWPSVVCTSVSTVILWIWIIPHNQTATPGELLTFMIFVGSAFLMSGLGQSAVAAQRHREARQRSDERYRTLFDSIDDGFCIIQMIFDEADRPVDYLFLEANQSFERQSGLLNAVGKTMRQMVPEHEQKWFDLYGEVARTGRSSRFEEEAVKMGRWFGVNAFRIDEPGEHKVAVLFSDITRRKKAIAALRASEQRLEEMIEAAPAFMVVLRGPDMIVERVNAAYMQLIGEGREVVGRPLLEALPEVSGQPFPELLKQVMSSGVAYRNESMQVVLARGPGGAPEARTVDFVYMPMREVDGSISGVMAHGIDVTERVRASQAVQASEERYRAIVEGQAEMVSRFRRDGTLLFVNGAYARSRGTTPEALIGTNLWEFIDEQDRAGVEAMLGSLRPDSPEVHIENRFETAEGVRWTLWHNRALAFDEDGQAQELQSAGIDITDRKIAEEALKRANADLLQFASAASHDLKEPLRGVSRLASFIAQDEPGLGPESRQRLERIRALCARLTTMVSGLIEHARTGLEPNLEPCDLNDVVRRIVDTSAEELAARGCEIKLRGRLPVVHADRILVERVFANLLANAVKFNQSEVKTVEFFWADGKVAVKDNGIGIDPRHQQSIFSIFRRMHSPEEYPGEGLGLALARKIVEAHGGTIDVESAVGQGSTFHLELPMLSPGSTEDEELVLVQPRRLTALDGERDMVAPAS